MKQMLFTVSLRRIATGYKETAFMVEDLNQAYMMASILVASSAFNHCNAVATDWKGDVVFNMGPQPAPAPMPQYAPAPQYPAMPPQAYQRPYQPQQQYAYQQAPMPQYAPPAPQYQAPALPAYQPHASIVIDADFEEVSPQTSRIPRMLGR